MRRRISIQREDRIWDLRCQGYTYDAIGSIVDVNPYGLTEVLRRIRRRPPLEQDPIRRGRGHSFLSDKQVESIRRRRRNGETLESIAKDYNITGVAVSLIARGISYAEPERIEGYPRSFANRLTA